MAWVRVCRLGDIPAGRGWPVRIGRWYVAVFQTAGGIRAVDNVCRHIGNPLDDGPVDGETVTCPWHGWRYDLRTGEHMTVFGRRPGLRTFPARLVGEEVEVDLPDG